MDRGHLIGHPPINRHESMGVQSAFFVKKAKSSGAKFEDFEKESFGTVIEAAR